MTNDGWVAPGETPPSPPLPPTPPPSSRGRRVAIIGSIALIVSVVLVVAVGSAVTGNDDRDGDVATPPRPVRSQERPTTTDHWHSAFSVYVCDDWSDPLEDVYPNTTGVHTHGDGVVHIHPFEAEFSGRHATVGLYAEMVGLFIDRDGIGSMDGPTYLSGVDTCDGEPASWHLVRYRPDLSTAPVEVVTSDIGAARFLVNREAFTLAFVPDSTDPADVGMPPSVPYLDEVSPTPN